MYTYGYEARHAELKLQSAVKRRWRGQANKMGAPLRYGSLPIYLLPRKASVFVCSTACHRLLYLVYTATTALLIPNTSSSFLVQSPTSRPAIRASQHPALPAALPESISNHCSRSTVTCSIYHY
jgi:hypothetical protein